MTKSMRQREILRFLEERPRKNIQVKDILDHIRRISDGDYDVSKRTIWRDMDELVMETSGREAKGYIIEHAGDTKAKETGLKRRKGYIYTPSPSNRLRISENEKKAIRKSIARAKKEEDMESVEALEEVLRRT